MDNRLASSSSPYLLQHAHNPVAWWPWCDEAFEQARTRGVPIFLSIGYSTCYWCHVMERESFENVTIAKQLNEHFVSIKLDREERPDLDELYMAATIAMSGHGGWPMSVFLDPESRKPFYCGTYFPAEPMYGRVAFPQLLEAIANAWKTERAGVVEQATQLAAAVAEHVGLPGEPVAVGSQQVTDAVSQLLRSFDRSRGGFGDAPKFPQVVYLDFLLEVRSQASDDVTLDSIDEALRRTLDAMMIGGIHDQIGGGFHRYSVDGNWTVPHFEKMLYDNAQLGAVYTRAAALYGDPQYERTARRTFDYVLSEMTDAGTGLFYSAQDAAVDGREGLNYLWTASEVRAALTRGEGQAGEAGGVSAAAGAGHFDEDNIKFALGVYGLGGKSNFQDPHHPAQAGEEPRSVLRLSGRPDRVAAEMGVAPEVFIERLDRINIILFAARAQRKQPSLDDKSLAAWNGMMIGALAIAAETFDEPRYLAAAERAAEAVLTHLFNTREVLYRSVRRGVLGPKGTLEDYAAVAAGLLALHRAASGVHGGNDGKLSDAAATLLARVAEDFSGARDEGDEGDGGVGGVGGGELGVLRLFDTHRDSGDVFLRPSSTHDGATPSGISVALHAMIDLHSVTGDAAVLRRAAACMNGISARIAASPLSTINSTRALLRLLVSGEETGLTLARVREGVGAASGPSSKDQPDADPVQIFAEVERVSLSEAQPHAVVTVLLKIEKGWHINAATVAMHPLRVHVVNGTGVSVFCDYPVAQVFAAAGQHSVAVYRDSVELTLVVEREGVWSGRPLLAVSYQACSEADISTTAGLVCLAPTTVELDIAVDAV